VFDHFTTVPDPTEEITFESFSMLAALAMVTSQVRLGHMVICTGFRNPALTAKLASTLDVISNGRFELGIGAGWKEDEWLAYGFGFPDVGERVGTLGDHLEIITRMLGPGRATYTSTYASVQGAINVPKGIQPHIPVIIGGNGRDRIAGYAITYGDELNLVYRDAAFAAERMREVRERCEREGRDPSTLRFSMYVGDDDLREPGKPRIEVLRAFAETGLDRLACFPGRWDTSVEGQERFAQDCEAAGIVLDGP
jgi:alkanesulfonate monooxygenase SsuD/methylene tetrahydromethanopterin reductase-like flavin-dependent oxidoreductase (luciferase family)